MATKVQAKVMATKDEGEIVTVYQEGPLFVWQAPDGWLVGHMKTGYGVCGKLRWKMKRDALAYLQALAAYKETAEDGSVIEFDWDGDFVDEESFWKVNEKEFCRRAFDACKNVTAQ